MSFNYRLKNYFTAFSLQLLFLVGVSCAEEFDSLSFDGLELNLYRFENTRNGKIHILDGKPQYLMEYPEWFDAFMAKLNPGYFQSYREWTAYLVGADKEKFTEDDFELFKEEPDLYPYYNSNIMLEFGVSISQEANSQLKYLLIIYSEVLLQGNQVNTSVKGVEYFFNENGSGWQAMPNTGTPWLGSFFYSSIDMLKRELSPDGRFKYYYGPPDFTIHKINESPNNENSLEGVKDEEGSANELSRQNPKPSNNAMSENFTEPNNSGGSDRNYVYFALLIGVLFFLGFVVRSKFRGR